MNADTIIAPSITSLPTDRPALRRPVLTFATQGAGGNEEARIVELLSHHPTWVFPFDRRSKLGAFWKLLKLICQKRPSLVVMEGTGIAGGLAVLLGRGLAGVPYVVSSGDAVGPWVGRQLAWWGPVFGLYERLLCFCAAGYIGWTPYLAGRALTFGTPRAVTAPGWAPFALSEAAHVEARRQIRRQLGIGDGDLVAGIAGALIWNRRVQYCYGADLVQAARHSRRSDLRILIVGDGTGLAQLRRLAGPLADRTVFFTGRVPQQDVPKYLAAMDLGSLPQSVDGVGNFRYTTKISEYLGARLPVVTGQLPYAYDLDEGWLWRLPGEAPWTGRYLAALTEFLDQVNPEQIEAKREAIAASSAVFSREAQVARVTAFIEDILDVSR